MTPKPESTTAVPRLAVVFPGQGAQAPGMGLDLARAYPFTAGNIFRTADRVSGYSLSRLIEKGSPGLLARTDITQPALLAANIATWEALRSALPGLSPSLAAGLSLGEYSALVAADVVDFESALRLVSWRGRFMEEAARAHAGGMSAVLGLERQEVERACAEARGQSRGQSGGQAGGEAGRGEAAGKVWVCNYNAPGQCVITGETAALERAAGLAAAAGAKVIPLKTSGPFHSPLIIGAARRLSPLLKQTPWREPRFPVYSNATGQMYPGAAAVAPGLEKQISSPVFWEDSIRDMGRRGVDTFIEVGPGRTLASLISRILPQATIVNVGDLTSLERAVETLAPYALEVVS
jgi:[acyl-carrier-protein] S-malonyltransferase